MLLQTALIHLWASVIVWPEYWLKFKVTCLAPETNDDQSKTKYNTRKLLLLDRFQLYADRVEVPFHKKIEFFYLPMYIHT